MREVNTQPVASIRFLHVLLAGCTVLALHGGAHADDRIWDQPAFGIFEFGTSWQGGIPPGQSDHAVLGATLTTTFNPITVQFGVDSAVSALTIESGQYTFIDGNPAVTLEVSGPFDVGTRRGAVDPGLSPAAGLIVDLDGTISTGVFSVGIDRGFGTRDGYVEIRPPARIESSFAHLGDAPGAIGVALVSGAGAEWIQDDNMAVGTSGLGRLTIAGGARVETNSPLFGGFIGIAAGSHGLVTVTGPGSTWDLLLDLSIGRDGGDGYLEILDGGAVLGNNAFLGVFNGSHGEAAVSGAGSSWTVQGLVVGVTGTAVLVAEDSAIIDAVVLTAAQEPGAAGVVIVDGADVHLQGELSIGRSGYGELSIRNAGMVQTQSFGTVATFAGSGGLLEVQSGASLSNTWFRLAGGIGSRGSAKVSGADSNWSNSEFLDVGNLGAGTLEIDGGGRVTAASANTGTWPGSEGIITVSGRGSTFETTAELRIGWRGRGRMVISDGGAVTSGWSRIGDEPGSSGIVRVIGSAAEWISSSFMDVGFLGDGRFELQNGGQAAATQFAIGARGVITGNGTLDGPLANGGQVQPNPDGGLVITGNYSQASAGVLAVTLDGLLPGVNYSQLQVLGAATLDGGLRIDIGQGFAPALGTTFEILTSASRSGKFAWFDCPAVPGGNVLAIRYTATSVILEVAEPCGATCYDLSADCDEDGIADACELAGCRPGDASCDDCNNNGVPDLCDVPPSAGCPDGRCDAGCAADANEDCVPDGCIAWDGGQGSSLWSAPANWDQDVVPDNSGADRYAVDISGPGTAVLLDIDAEIDSLRLLDGATLALDQGSLSLATPGGVRHDGALTVADGRALIAAAPMVRLSGASPLTLAGSAAALSAAARGDSFTNSATIQGEGLIEAGLVNHGAGVILANSAANPLVLTGSAKVNHGVLRAEAGGTLTISDVSITGSGSLEAAGGAIAVVPAMGEVRVGAGDAQILDSGRLEVDGGAEVNIAGPVLIDSCGFVGPVSMPAGALQGRLSADAVQIAESPAGGGGEMFLTGTMSLDVAGVLHVQGFGAPALLGGCTPPRLGASGGAVISAGELFLEGSGRVELAGNAVMNVAGSLVMAESGDPSPQLGGATPPRIDALEGARVQVGGDWVISSHAVIQMGSAYDAVNPPVQLAGDLVNGCTTPATFNWSAGALTLAGASPQSVEAAGEDRGAVPTGLMNNFAIGTFEIAPGAAVTLADGLDNDQSGQAPCSEALYVQHLILGPRAELTLEHATVYFETLTNHGGTIHFSGCGQLALICGGDFTGDCAVTLEDYNDWYACYTAPGPGAAEGPCAPADLDGDHDVDRLDFRQLQTRFAPGLD